MNNREVEIIRVEACSDYAHVLVSAGLQKNVPEFVGYLNGKSSLIIYDRFVNLKYRYGNRYP